MKNAITILLLGFISFSCSRKLHTERTETNEVSTEAHVIDSLNRVIRTLSQAYESLLRATNSTGVVFESTPCDSATIGGSGMPHIIEHADGSKEFIGRIKSYQSDATKYQRTIFSLQNTVDSFNSLSKKDTTHKEASAVVVVRNVKSTFIPIWVWVVMGVLGFAFIAKGKIKSFLT